jgi:hypothetical protein
MHFYFCGITTPTPVVPALKKKTIVPVPNFNAVTPDWMKVGPEDTTAFPCEDVLINEINSTAVT